MMQTVDAVDKKTGERTTAQVETNCTIEHEGKTYESGGAFVSDAQLVAYLGKASIPTFGTVYNGIVPVYPVQTWHGEMIGTARERSRWRTPRSFLSSTMSTWDVRLTDGRRYTAWGAGTGCILRGRRAGGKR